VFRSGISLPSSGHMKVISITRDVRKVSSHFEYLENRSSGLDVTWQPVRDLTAHPLSRGASQSAVRLRWLSLCIVWPSHSQISYLSKAILALGNVRSRREPNLGSRSWGGLTELGDVMLCPKRLHESCIMGRRIVVMNLIFSLGHCECDGHTIH